MHIVTVLDVCFCVLYFLFLDIAELMHREVLKILLLTECDSPVSVTGATFSTTDGYQENSVANPQ